MVEGSLFLVVVISAIMEAYRILIHGYASGKLTRRRRKSSLLAPKSEHKAAFAMRLKAIGNSQAIAEIRDPQFQTTTTPLACDTFPLLSPPI